MKKLAVLLLCAFITGVVLESCATGEKCPAYTSVRKGKRA